MSRVATLGASNAVRTAAALGEAGVEVIGVGKAGWRPSVEAVEAIKEELGLEMGEHDVLVVQCLDSSCLYVMNTATGGLELPKRGADGMYHIEGRPVIAKDMQLDNLLEKVVLLLQWRPNALKILISPTVRYLTNCCATHTRSEQELKMDGQRMLKELGELRRSVKSMLVKKKIQNVILIDPLLLSGAASDLEKAKQLMLDQVHMRKEGYAALAGRIKETIHNWLLVRKRKVAALGEVPAKRTRLATGAKL
jgi:hypothetical protein